jgi:hypothetical protein
VLDPNGARRLPLTPGVRLIMRRVPILGIAIAALLLGAHGTLAAGSEGAEQALGRFRVQISWVTFVPGEIVTSVTDATNATHYLITPGELVVRYPNAGLKQSRMLLTPEQSKSIYLFLETVRYAKLRETYNDLSVDDGFGIDCTIQVDNGPTMHVTLRSVWQADVVALSRKLNALLPAELAILVPSEARKAN